jgi:hypothetical protein
MTTKVEENIALHMQIADSFSAQRAEEPFYSHAQTGLTVP